MILGKTTWHGDERYRQVVQTGAAMLLRMAVFFQAEMMARLNVPNTGVRVKRTRDTVGGKRGSSYTVYPNSSQPGAYLRKRTGWLAGHILYEPRTVAEVEKLGRVRVGYGKSAFYGAVWELKTAERRKGLIDLLAELRPQLEAMARTGR